jgi:transposase
MLADLAIGRMRTAGKLADLSQALTGRFTDHHAVLCRLHLDRIALFDAAVAGLEAKIAVKVSPYRRELDLLKSIDGFGDAVAHAWLAEIGPAPHEYFASHEKLASWVTLCPGNHMSAGKRSHGRTGKAGTYIKPMLVQAAWSAIKTQGPAAGQVPQAGAPVRGPEEPGRGEEGDSRDRPHPFEDRLPGAQQRQAV